LIGRRTAHTQQAALSNNELTLQNHHAASLRSETDIVGGEEACPCEGYPKYAAR